ncbi:MAG: hypothetical protein ACRCUE_21725, partial [Bosea sp. (in: a-proteobacteria)]
TAAATPEQPSVLQRVMSFNPFAASAPAVTETPAASQSEAKPAQTRAQQPTRTAPQASAASGVRVAQRPAPVAAEAD